MKNKENKNRLNIYYKFTVDVMMIYPEKLVGNWDCLTVHLKTGPHTSFCYVAAYCILHIARYLINYSKIVIPMRKISIESEYLIRNSIISSIF